MRYFENRIKKLESYFVPEVEYEDFILNLEAPEGKRCLRRGFDKEGKLIYVKKATFTDFVKHVTLKGTL